MCIVCNNFMLIDLIDSQWLRRKLTTLEKGNGFCFLDDLIRTLSTLFHRETIVIKPI